MKDVRLYGMVELEKALEKFAKQLGPQPVEKVLYEGAVIVRNDIQTRVNTINAVTGRLRRSPVAKMLQRRKHGEPRPSIAGVDRTIAFHAGWVEFGTSRSRAQPFFRPAWDSKRAAALKHIRDRLKRMVEEGAR